MRLRIPWLDLTVALLSLGTLAFPSTQGRAEDTSTKKKIVFLPGKQSHGWSAHAYPADCAFLAGQLNVKVSGVEAVVIPGGWPKDLSVLKGAAAIVIACDDNNLIGPEANYQALDVLAKQGVGLAFLHYALDPGKEAGRHLLDWIGGYYERFWSVNPSWKAEFKSLPRHPITRGVKPFALDDEWYYHLRFQEGMKGVTPLLSAVPPEKTRQGPDGPHSGNPAVRARKGMAEHVAWAYERPDGGRGFGCTGGHVHWNYAQNDLRKLLLNAFCWIARVEVPPEGVLTPTPTAEEMEANLPVPRPKNWTREQTQRIIDHLNKQP
jgi:type 1 glutamine amidotransferase